MKRCVTPVSSASDQPDWQQHDGSTAVIAATDWAKTAKATSQNDDNESLYLHGLKNVV